MQHEKASKRRRKHPYSYPPMPFPYGMPPMFMGLHPGAYAQYTEEAGDGMMPIRQPNPNIPAAAGRPETESESSGDEPEDKSKNDMC